MARSRIAAVAFLLATLAFAGCVADEVEPEASEDAAEAAVTEKTGSVTGQVITVDLDLLPGIDVGLVNRTGGVEVTTTDKQARFTFNDVAPGPYRIQIDAPCCKATSVKVDVVAAQVAEVNVQLERLTAVDLVEPFMVEEQWDGFIGCDVSTFSAGQNLCEGIDANQDTIKLFDIEPGIQELVVGMHWDENTAAEDLYGNALGLHLHDLNCDECGEGNYRYLRIDKSSPIIAFVNDGTILEEPFQDPERKEKQLFSLITETREMRWSVYSGGTNVVYQQAFTLYWYEFYHQRSPVDFYPIPEGG